MSEQQILPEMVDEQDKKNLKQREVVKEEIRTERFDVRISPELKKTLKELGKKEGKTQPELMDMLFSAYVDLQSLKKDEDVEGEVRRFSELAVLEKALNQVRTAFLSQIASYQFEVQDAQLDLSNIKSELEEEISLLNNKIKEQEGLNIHTVEELKRTHSLELLAQEKKFDDMEIRLKEKIESLESELVESKNEIDLKESSLRQERMITTSQAGELEALKVALANKEEGIAILDAKVKSFGQIESELSTVKTSNDELSREVARLRAENDRLVQALDTSNKQNQFYSSQIEEIRTDYSSRINTLENSHKEQIENLKEQCTFYKEQIKNLNSQRDSVSMGDEK